MLFRAAGGLVQAQQLSTAAFHPLSSTTLAAGGARPAFYFAPQTMPGGLQGLAMSTAGAIPVASFTAGAAGVVAGSGTFVPRLDCHESQVLGFEINLLRIYI